MGVNKFVLNTSDGEEVKFDLTGDTVTASDLAEGVTAHGADGEQIIGTMPLDVVRYGIEQTLTDSQKQQARKNIGVIGEGKDGQDGYTPVKGVDYFDGKDGADGSDGVGIQSVSYRATEEDGAEVPIMFTLTNGKTHTVNVKNGSKGSKGEDGYTPVKNKDYFDGEPGKDGTSVTITKVTESAVDGGLNVVEFSDGTTLEIRNGKAGEAAQRGTGIYRTTSEPEAYTGTVDGKQMIARTTSAVAYLPGDMFLWRSMLYRVAVYDNPYVYMDVQWSIQGEAGEPGADGTSVTVSSVVESTEDGGENIVTFSDGTVLIVRNGNAGSGGGGGTAGVEGELRVVVHSKDTQTIINKSYPVSKTNAEIYEAYSSGRQVALYDGSASGATDLTTERYEAYRIERERAYFYRDVVVKNKATVRKWWLIGGTYSDRASLSENAYIAPNPYALTINGKSYDGSAAVNVDIEAGGTDILMVNFSSEDGETWTADKTHAEMLAAHNEGKLLCAQLNSGEILQLLTCNEEAVWFGLVLAMDGQSMCVIMQVYANDEVSFSISPITAESNVMVVRPVEPITDGGGMKYIVDHTSDEIVEATQAGKLVVFAMTATLTLERFDTFAGCVFSRFSPDTDADALNVGTYTTATVEGNVAQLMDYYIKPKLPPLTINGVEYDGSKAVEVNVAGGGGSDSKRIICTISNANIDIAFNMPVEDIMALGDAIHEYEISIVNISGGSYSNERYLVTGTSYDSSHNRLEIEYVEISANIGLDQISIQTLVVDGTTGTASISAAYTTILQNPTDHEGEYLSVVDGSYQLVRNPLYASVAMAIDDGENIGFLGGNAELENLLGGATEAAGIASLQIMVFNADQTEVSVYKSSAVSFREDAQYLDFCNGIGKILRLSTDDGSLSYVEPDVTDLVSAVIAKLPVYGGETA